MTTSHVLEIDLSPAPMKLILAVKDSGQTAHVFYYPRNGLPYSVAFGRHPEGGKEQFHMSTNCIWFGHAAIDIPHEHVAKVAEFFGLSLPVSAAEVLA